MATSTFDREFVIEDEAAVKRFWRIDDDEGYRRPIYARPQMERERRRSEELLKGLLSH